MPSRLPASSTSETRRSLSLSPPRRSLARGPALVLFLGALVATGLVPSAARAQEGTCVDGPTTLCLDDQRFEVKVEWHDFTPNPFFVPGLATSGEGQAVHLEPATNVDTGFFWFYDEDDVELVVKIIDGRQINQHFWVFVGSLTNVEYTLRVTDTETGRIAQYFNPPGDRTVVEDTSAFEETGGGTGGPQAIGGGHALRRSLLPREALPSCGDDAVTCVRGGRFAIQSVYSGPNPADSPLMGRADYTTATSALLRHGGLGSNPDTFVKVIDGREVNGSFWVAAATLLGESPGTEVTVTDLQTARAVSYVLSEGGILSVGDRLPFAPDPPAGAWLETAEIPGFRFKVRVTGGGGEVPVRQERECIPETLCISGAIPGRSELFLRMVGPKPNGFLWPNVVKFSTSQIEVWVEQLSSGVVNYYLLEGASPGSDELTGFFDRTGFTP